MPRYCPIKSVGHTHAFGNTEEHLRVQILGVARRGKPGSSPLDHKTGNGWVKAHRGDYHDAIHNKGNRVIPFITSPSGGIAPQGLAHLKLLARSSRLAGGRDGTSYGLARTSPRSFFTHHLQRISSALVRAAARDISEIISGLKQRAALGVAAV